ncbi:MAG: EAL domain-containing protein [Actinobacteria bacterium]|nr:EAL domain-containing protein [Actinomycetota bacterium]
MSWDWASDGDDLARLIAENSADLICRLDTSGVIAWVADSLSECLGWKPGELVGREMIDFVDADDHDFLESQAGGLLAGRAAGAEPASRPPVRWHTPDGGLRWVSGTAVPEVNSDGHVGAVVVALRDVTDLVEARVQAQADAQQWQAAMDSMLDPFVVMTAVRDDGGLICDFKYTQANQAAADYNRVPLDAWIGSRLLVQFPGHRESGLFDSYVRVIEEGEPLVLDNVETLNELLGDVRRYDIRAAKSGDSLVLTWRDVTQRHRDFEGLADQEAVYRMATESAYDAVAQVDGQGVVEWVSPSFEQISGYAPEDFVGKSAFVLVAPEDLERIAASFESAMAGRPQEGDELQIVTAQGGRRWVQARSRVVEGRRPGEISLVTLLRDIDAEVRAREAMEQTVRIDELTGLATWPAVRSDLAADGRVADALLCVSVDRLRSINESVSYAGGDEVLVEVSRRISSAVPPRARVGRIAGSEFVVAIPDLRDRTPLAVVAQQVCTAVALPVTVSGRDVHPTVSVGIAQAQVSPDELLRRAGLAMRAAKAEGGGHWRFDDPAAAAEAERRLWVESRLRRALAAGEIRAWFQPVVRLEDRELVGYEALARWVRADGVVVPPSEFLDVAEASGLVVDLDFAILEQALAAVAGMPDMKVSVNVSARTLVGPDYARRVSQALDASGFEPARLRLEVTETALMFDHAAAVRATTALALKGVKWWLDDFGTGYSTLTHLRDFPISGIKLDRSFTLGVEQEDLAATRLARALVGMAQGLGLESVAEGVETQLQMRLLREQGWQNGQGWLFGRPAPLTE